MKSGFTLVELLVVIAVIFLLLATLMPALQTARENAKTVVCGSNIKQILIALTVYENQNRTFPYCRYNTTPSVPPLGGYAGQAAYDMRYWYWFDFISNYSGKSRSKSTVLWCPARNIREGYQTPNILLGNYGINEAICRNFTSASETEIKGVPLRSSQIPHPADTMLAMDSGYTIITWYHAADANIVPITLSNTHEDSGYVPGLYEVNKGRLPYFRSGVDFTTDALIGRHPKKGVNAGFVDGHVARQKADDFYVQKTGDAYKNRFPLWLPYP
jgi:prepilin-type processing-associated H-X9-DG protein/prepilin-type N-terminal cleavage/methylation domain-containing protein